MNLLEHYIVEIHSEKDITNEFTQHCGYVPKEPFLQIDLTYNCYGSVKRTTESFWKSNWEEIKKKGYFLSQLN